MDLGPPHLAVPPGGGRLVRRRELREREGGHGERHVARRHVEVATGREQVHRDGEQPGRRHEAEDPGTPGEHPEADDDLDEAVRLVERAVDGLAQPYRVVFMLRDVEQLSTAETAAALGLGEDAVKVRLHRARGMLRRALGEAVERAAPEAFPFLAPRCNRMVERVMVAIAGTGTGAA